MKDFFKFLKFRKSLLSWIVLAAVIIAGASTVVIFKVKFHHPAYCSAQQVTGTAFLQGETGYEVGNLILKNISAKPCRLPYRPTLAILSHGETLTVAQAAMGIFERKSTRSTPLSVLNPQSRTVVSLMWGNWCSSALNRKSEFKGLLLISLVASTSPLRANLTAAELPRCDWPNQPSTMAVGPFQSS